MLTIKAPIELKCNTSMVSSQEAFYHKVTGNYGIISSGITKEDLLHVVTAPSEVYLAEGGMTNIVNQTSLQNHQENKINILNNFLNRISVKEDVELTYQDRVYISNVLRQLGVTNVQEFMRQVSLLKEENRNTEELISLYWDNLTELSHTVKEYHYQDHRKQHVDVSAENRKEHHLHQDVMNRLQTGAIYQILNNFYKSRWNLGQYVDRQELMVSEQKRTSNQILLNQLKTVIRGEEVPFVYRHENYYEDVNLNENQITDEKINSQITSAVLLNLIDNLFLTRMERNFGDHQVWMRMEEALYQAAENTLIRFKNEISEYRIHGETKEEIQIRQNAYYRREIEAAERVLQAVREQREASDETSVNMIVQDIMQRIEMLPDNEPSSSQKDPETSGYLEISGEKKKRKTPDVRPVFMERVEAMLDQAESAVGKNEKRPEEMPEKTVMLHMNLEDHEKETEEIGTVPPELSVSSGKQESREEAPVFRTDDKLTLKQMEHLTTELTKQEIEKETRRNLEVQVEQYLEMTAAISREVYQTGERTTRITDVVSGDEKERIYESRILEKEKFIDQRSQVRMVHPQKEEQQEHMSALREVRFGTVNELNQWNERYLTEESTNIKKQRTEQQDFHLHQDGDMTFTHAETVNRYEEDQHTYYQNPEENPELLMEQIQIINQQNIENWNRVQKLLESQRETAERQTVISTEQLRKESLKALTAPQDLIYQYREEAEQEKQVQEKKNSELYELLTPDTRRIFEMVSEYQKAPENLPLGQVGKNQIGMLLQDVRQIEQEQNHVRTVHREDAETIREVSETVLEKWKEESIRESVPSSRMEIVRRDMNLVHKQLEQQINEEFLEELLAENRIINQKHQVTEKVQEERHSVKTQLINQSSHVNYQENQDLTELIQRGVQKQIGALSDQIYSRLEKKLQNEKKRRGY